MIFLLNQSCLVYSPTRTDKNHPMMSIQLASYASGFLIDSPGSSWQISWGVAWGVGTFAAWLFSSWWNNCFCSETKQNWSITQPSLKDAEILCEGSEDIAAGDLYFVDLKDALQILLKEILRKIPTTIGGQNTLTKLTLHGSDRFVLVGPDHSRGWFTTAVYPHLSEPHRNQGSISNNPWRFNGF